MEHACVTRSDAHLRGAVRHHFCWPTLNLGRIWAGSGPCSAYHEQSLKLMPLSTCASRRDDRDCAFSMILCRSLLAPKRTAGPGAAATCQLERLRAGVIAPNAAAPLGNRWKAYHTGDPLKCVGHARKRTARGDQSTLQSGSNIQGSSPGNILACRRAGEVPCFLRRLCRGRYRT